MPQKPADVGLFGDEGKQGLLLSGEAKPPVATPMWKTTAQQEADKISKHYGDLFNSLRSIDSHPFWGREETINRAADIKNALINSATPEEINRTLKIEQDFRAREGMSYSQYQSGIFGGKPTHPQGLTDWAEWFQQREPRQLPADPASRLIGDIGPKQEPYDFLTGRRPDAPFPQFAERYPDIGPPTMKPKTSGEGTYPEKTLTPEAEGVATARSKIMKQMQDEGYQPFFDPSQRVPAQFEKQPGPHVDTAQAVAAKQETIDRHLQTIGAPETLQRLREGYSRGLDLPDSQAWYLMGQVERKMIEDMGEEAGRKHFRDTIATAMAATTTGSTPPTNLIMAQYLNYLKKTGQPFPAASYETPVAVGGQRTMANIDAYNEIFGKGGYEGLGLQNPKRTDFAQALMGNPQAFTVDEQMAHGMIGKDVPQKGTYGLVTKVGREEAARAGVDPARYQDVTWAGFKKMLEEEGRAKKGFRPYGEGEGYQGKPMISEVNDMIERMHRLTGMPRQEIWTRGFIKNEIPIYGAGGLTLGGVLSSQMQPAAP